MADDILSAYGVDRVNPVVPETGFAPARGVLLNKGTPLASKASVSAFHHSGTNEVGQAGNGCAANLQPRLPASLIGASPLFHTSFRRKHLGNAGEVGFGMNRRRIPCKTLQAKP